jgi:hypothetical protein
MAKTPFIRSLQVSGGTFYTFSSAAEDLSFTFNNTVNKFKFSKFVLLNLPKFQKPVYRENSIQFDAIDTAFMDVATGNYEIVDPNNLSPNLETSFQNYCLNMESTILSDPAYNSQKKQTVAEKVFFKWLKEVGGIRYRPANSNEVNPVLDQVTTSTVGGYPSSQKRWTEEDTYTFGNGTPTPRYNRVVQYIGECDIVNSVQNQNNSYSEVYIHVPTSDGNTPLVLFKTTADENYYPGKTWTNSPSDPINSVYLQGRDGDSGTVGPNGISILGIFDQSFLGNPQVITTDSTGATGSASWHDPRNVTNSYFSEDSFFDSSNISVLKYETTGGTGGYTVNYLRNNLDGVQIDFDPTSYKPIIDNPALSIIEQYNSTADSSNFEFNAVLIYYDVYDPNNPVDSSTNLYGVLFLEDIVATGINQGQIPPFKKYKPDPVTKLNGNSYGLKLNLKFDTSVENTGVEQAINDYSSFSMSLFMDSATVLQQAAGALNDRTLALIDLQTKYEQLYSVVINSNNGNNLDTRLQVVENALQVNQALFNNTQDVMGLIERNYAMINSILQGTTNIAMSYDLDLIKQGKGISVDRSVPNRITVNNTVQNYSLDPSSYQFSINPVGITTLPLRHYTTYYKHRNSGLTISATNDIIIRIDDTLVKWSLGQTMRLVIDDPIILSTNSIFIYTDTTGLYPLSNPSAMPYNILIGGFTQSSFVNSNNKPMFDIVCVDEKNLIFEIDQVR